MGRRHRSAGEGRSSHGHQEGKANPGFDAGRRRLIRFYGKSDKEVQELPPELPHGPTKGTLWVAHENLRVGDYLLRWLHDYAATGVRPATYYHYSQSVRLHLIPGLGQTLLTSLRPLHLQRLYAAKLKAGLSPRTVRYLHDILHRALGHAARWGLTTCNVADAVNPPRLCRRQTAVLTPMQAADFLKAAAPSRLHALYVLALTTGMRQGEILALRWHDVEFDTSSIYVRRTLHRLGGRWFFAEPMSARGRRSSVALPTIAVTALHQHEEEQQREKERTGNGYRDQGLVFCKPDGDPLDGSWLTHHTQRLLRKIGLPAIRFHDFRHTHAAMLFQLGIPPEVVSERLGISSIKLALDTHSNLWPVMQRDAADKVDVLFRHPQSLNGEAAD